MHCPPDEPMKDVVTIRLSRYALPAEPLGVWGQFKSGNELWRASLGGVVAVSVSAQMLLTFCRELVVFSGGPGGAFELRLVSLGLFGLAAVFYVVTLIALTFRIWSFAGQSEMSTVAAYRSSLSAVPKAVVAGIIYSVAVVIGTLALVVPGIYLSIALAMAIPCALFEDLRAVVACRRSARLVRGAWWRTATVLSLPATAYLVIVVAVAAALYVHYGFRDPDFGLVIGMIPRVASSFLCALITAVMMPWFIAMTLVVYNDLRVRETVK